VYGPHTNEELLGRALKGKPRQSVVIATKFGIIRTGDAMSQDSSPPRVKQSVEGSLRRLGTDYIDLYYQHRLDPKTPIEETVRALSDLVKEGKVRYIGLSEVGPGTIRRAHAVHPVSAVQSEYSLWERDIEEKVLPAMRELGIGLVAYSPIGRGVLSGKIKSLDDLDADDWRRGNPRFQGDALEHNLQLVDAVNAIASEHRATPAQVALGWLLRRGSDIVPIPGTKRLQYLEENAEGAELNLPDSAWTKLDTVIADFKTQGLRYPEPVMSSIDTTE
jgi:aryl-alcohol dehydrogenase-like predicted oxidoreductase